MQGIKMIKAKTNGNKTVQQKDISWSKRIRGNAALTHINVNTAVKFIIQINKQSFNYSYKPSSFSLPLFIPALILRI